MSAAERFKKRVRGNAPHATKKQDTFSSRGLARSPISYEKRKSGRNETDPRKRKIGFSLNFN
tara:strand:- start:926 stop:1111 length:186 start_codon:yes stop_codon:yes gene_type:complete